MTIPVTPEFSDPGRLAGPLAQQNAAIGNIAAALGGILQPYKQQELNLRAAISKDPSLAQNLADLAALNPNGLAALVGPKAASYFAGLEASPQIRARVATRPQQEEVMNDPESAKYIGTQQVTGGKTTPGGIAEDRYKQTIADATREAVETNPALRAAAEARKAAGKDQGQVAAAANRAEYLQATDALYKLQADGQLLPEFQKYITGQESLFTGQMLNAALDPANPLGKTLLIPYLEQQRNARVAMLADSRQAGQFMSQRSNLDRLLIDRALDMVVKTGYNNTAAFIKLLSGRDDLVSAYGGYTSQQLQEAQNALSEYENRIGANSRQRAVDANTRILQNWKNTPSQVRGDMVEQLNRNAEVVGDGTVYYVDGKGIKRYNLYGSGGDITGNTRAGQPTRTEPNVPPGQGSPVVEKETVSATGPSQRTTQRGSEKQWPAHISEMRKRAANLTADQIKKSPKFQQLKPDEQAFVLQGAKK